MLTHPLHIMIPRVVNTKNISELQYSHQGSHMKSHIRKCRYCSKVNMAFWEKATFVFWLRRNSWFWVWNFFFTISIFHKIHFVYYVSRPFLHQKALKQGICHFLPQVLCHCGTKSHFETNALFEGFLVQKWPWHIVHKVNFKKNCYSKKFFSRPKSAVLTTSKHKCGIFSKGHVNFWIVPTFLNMTIHLWALMRILELANVFSVHHPY